MPDNGVNAGALAGAVAGGIMLFGVRLTVDSMRKSVSLNDLSHYALPNEVAAVVAGAAVGDGAGCYASADEAAAPSTPPRERKRGIPWTEEEHRLFLIGLQKVGKGDWRGISRNFVKTRTPTQVASHAQKYFIRRSNVTRRRRRSSLFDITTDVLLTDLRNSQLISSGDDKKPPLANDHVPPPAMKIGDRYPSDDNLPEISPSNYRNPIEINPEPSTLSLELSLALEEHNIVIRPAFPSFSGDSVISVG